MNYTINVNINMPSGTESGLSSAAASVPPVPAESMAQGESISGLTGAPQPAAILAEVTQKVHTETPSPVPELAASLAADSVPGPAMGFMEGAAGSRSLYEAAPGPEGFNEILAPSAGSLPTPESFQIQSSAGHSEAPEPEGMDPKSGAEKPKASPKGDKK